ncbi:hypothetical protein [Micromonospora sp. NPDC023737]|uniref:hypothetical protein n=1 Tax=unclassified Micromonospora TaxID=2617518 RepID=UPI0033D7A54F
MAAEQTGVAGIYGMNFAHLPGPVGHDGYRAGPGAAALAALTLHRLFRRSGRL